MPQWSKHITFHLDSELSEWLTLNELSKNSGPKKGASRIKQYYKCTRAKSENCDFQAHVVSYNDKPEKDVYITSSHRHTGPKAIPAAAKRIMENCDQSKIAPRQARILLQKCHATRNFSESF